MSRQKVSDLYSDGKLLVLLLVALLALLAVIPLLERYTADRYALTAGLTVILVAGASLNRRYPAFFVAGGVLLTLAIPMTWATLFVDHVGLFAGSCAVAGVFFVMTAIATMWGVFRWHTARVHSIFGAVSAYLLLGLAWAMFYWGLQAVNPEALDIPHRRTLPDVVGGQPLTSFSQMVYFSFVCMSSLGFGDITPTTPIAETICWLQAVVGQFYLAILVARLVAAIPVERRRRETDLGD